MLIIAHRGAMGYEPENTLPSFQKAIDMKSGMIEMDVYQCKTGELVIHHDLTTKKPVNSKIYIEEMTFEEIRSIDAGNGANIPELKETLDFLNNRISINLELKGGNTAKPVYRIIEQYVKNRSWNYNDFYISSFNHPLLLEFISLIPSNCEIKICPLTCGIPAGLAEFGLQLKAYSVNISAEFVNSDYVKDAHKRGMKVFVYVVNDLIELKRMESLGVDGIFTNYPDIMNKTK